MAMMMAGGHGHENPNANYMNGRGFWLFYILVLAGAHVVLVSQKSEIYADWYLQIWFIDFLALCPGGFVHGALGLDRHQCWTQCSFILGFSLDKVYAVVDL